MGKKLLARIQDKFIREVNVNYRKTNVERIRISDARRVADFVRSILIDNSREHSIALFLDGYEQVSGYSIISIGDYNSVQFSPRELFQRAILVGSSSLVVAHNHPSGSLTPSNADFQVTERLKEAGSILGISILDHVIITDHNFVSLQYPVPGW